MSPLGFAFGAAGGASGGFAPAFETIMRNRQVEQGLELDERSLDLRADDLAFRMDAASEERAQRDKERGLLRGSGEYTTRDPDELLNWERAYADANRAPQRPDRPNYDLVWGEEGAYVFDPRSASLEPLNVPESGQLQPRPRVGDAGGSNAFADAAGRVGGRGLPGIPGEGSREMWEGTTVSRINDAYRAGDLTKEEHQDLIDRIRSRRQ